jgi:hypothetical protein
VHEKHNFNLCSLKKKKKKKKKLSRTEKSNKEINKKHETGKANYKPKGKERIFGTQTTIEP